MITYRIAATRVYTEVDQPLVSEYAKLVAAGTGSVINLIVISLLDVGMSALATHRHVIIIVLLLKYCTVIK